MYTHAIGHTWINTPFYPQFISTGQNSVTFRVVKEIKCGDELTAYYGNHYYGENNYDCRCATCER